MRAFIAIPANNRHLKSLETKAALLGCSKTDESLTSKGLTIRHEQSVSLVVFSYHEELWAYIESLEPVNERKVIKAVLVNPSALEIVTLGYPK